MVSIIEILGEILQIIGFAVLIISMILFYRKYKFGAVRYFVYAVLILAQRAFSFLNREDIQGSRITFGNLTLDLIGLILALYCLLLFFESFDSETPYTKRNLGILVAISAVCTGLLILYWIVQREEFSFPNVESVRLAELNYGTLFSENIYILLMFFLFSIIGLILLLIQSFILLKKLYMKEKNTEDPEIKKKLINLRYAFYFLPLIAPIFTRYEQFARFLFVLIAVFIAISVLKGGIFIFRSELLQLLFVLDDSGIPSYSFRFRDISSERLTDDDEMLFSGALKAVSMLFQNLTGSEVDLKEIVLENAHVMIQRIPIQNQSLSAVLIAKKSSSFYQDALNLFAQLYSKKANDISSLEVISGAKRQEIDEIVKKCFGIL